MSHLMSMCHCLVRMPFTVDSADAVMTTLLVSVRCICTGVADANTFVEGDEQTRAATLLLHVVSEAQLLVERVAESAAAVGTPIVQPRIVLLDAIMQVSEWVGIWRDKWVGGWVFDHSLSAIAAASIHVHDSMMMTMTLLGDAQQ